jgi:hypothetical protein
MRAGYAGKFTVIAIFICIFMRAGYAGKFTVIAIFICILFSCLSVSTQAAIPDTGMITGYVLDEEGNPVSTANFTP